MVAIARALLQPTNIFSVACSQSKRNPGCRSMSTMFCIPPLTPSPPRLNLSSFSGRRSANPIVVGCSDSKVGAVEDNFGSGEKRLSRVALPEAMLERFTDQAVKVVMLAQDEARRLSHNFIGTEHLLLGLRREDRSIAAKALLSLGFYPEDVRLKVAKLVGRGSGFVTVEIPFMPHARRVLEHAIDEALQLGHCSVAPEHILLGLIREGEGAGISIIEWLGVPLDGIRTAVIEMIHKEGEFPMAAMIDKWNERIIDYDKYPDTPLDWNGLKPGDFSFEKPLLDLDEKITKLRGVILANRLQDLYDPVMLLKLKLVEVIIHSEDHLTQVQRMAIARHPFRPTVNDYIENITNYEQLHGDQAGYDDDPAIVGGLGSIEGECYMFIGHQKVRNTEENFEHNFAGTTPYGYEKALRMMKFAEHCGFPIVTFVDTAGSFTDLKSEELGQGEAIAHNLRTIFGLKVPIITIVTGEVGSGGALASACANKLLILENSAFYVASQDACTAIRQKFSSAGLKVPEKLTIAAQEHSRLRIAGCLIPELENGAHAHLDEAYSTIKIAILKAMEEVRGLGFEELMRHRMLKFEAIGEIGCNNKEDGQVEQEKRRKMKPSDAKALRIAEIESQLEELTMKFLAAKGTFDPVILPGDRCYVSIPFRGFPIRP